MKKLLLLVLMCFASSAFADVPHASLTPIKNTHQKAPKHHAHKAGKHRTPKRNHHAV